MAFTIVFIFGYMVGVIRISIFTIHGIIDRALSLVINIEGTGSSNRFSRKEAQWTCPIRLRDKASVHVRLFKYQIEHSPRVSWPVIFMAGGGVATRVRPGMSWRERSKAEAGVSRCALKRGIKSEMSLSSRNELPCRERKRVAKQFRRVAGY